MSRAPRRVCFEMNVSDLRRILNRLTHDKLNQVRCRGSSKILATRTMHHLFTAKQWDSIGWGEVATVNRLRDTFEKSGLVAKVCISS